MKIRNEIILCLLAFSILSVSMAPVEKQINPILSSVEWIISDFINNTPEGVTILGDPKLCDSKYGSAVAFNGINDAILLDYSPLVNLTQFTIEVIMRPDSGGLDEQRFLHFGSIEGNRALLETRLTKENNWYVDGFLMSGNNKKALIDSTLLHPLNEWYHVAFVVDNGKMQVFVNGKTELEGELEFSPFTTGQTSIGVRMNKLYWYKGAFYKIRISPENLTPDSFMKY